ncbi:MAG: 4-phosphoerythronate dehydrogenase [Spongiibacteraceae bacterium]|jgi:erythronate-4-phosphate dehydrogenase|nr:4-phosphoerythronate dehydrogenase [Spongiibacteraceae bacterium]
MSSLTIVADENMPRVVELFSALGRVRTVAGRTMSAADVADADVLLVRSVTPVNSALLAGSPVRWVGTATIGVDHLDTEWLRTQGIGYANAPGCNAVSVVEYVLSVLAVLDGVLEPLLARQARVGIVGLGNVGGRLLQRLQTMGIEAVGYDPLLAGTADMPAAVRPALVPLAEVLGCEVICLHTPLTRTGRWPTHHLIGERELGQLQPGSVLLNAGRGPVIDNQALLRTLERRSSALRVVLDVWEQEPAIAPLLLDRVAIGTPHIAGYSLDGKLRGTEMLLAACCTALGLPLSSPQSPATGVSAVELPDPGATGVQLIRDALLAVYDVREDDARLRAAVAGARGDRQQIGAAFDRLRKEYPVRRELSAVPLRQWQSLSDAQRGTLLALGFREAGQVSPSSDSSA